MNTGPVKPLVTLAAASSRFRILPDFSSISRFRGSEAVRLTSWRGLQNESWIWTSVKGTGRSFKSGASAAKDGIPTNASKATARNCFMKSFLTQKKARAAL